MKISTQIKIALFAAIISVSAQIMLPLPGGVPATMQTFAVALCAFILGRRGAVWAVAIYLLLGAVGAPVFSGFRGGFHVLFGLTGGFLWGFIPFVLILGGGGKASAILGIILCHILGCIQFALISGNGFAAAFFASSAPFILKDIISVFLARLTSYAIIKRI